MTGLIRAQESDSAISLSGTNLSYVVVVALVVVLAACRSAVRGR